MGNHLDHVDHVGHAGEPAPPLAITWPPPWLRPSCPTRPSPPSSTSLAGEGRLAATEAAGSAAGLDESLARSLRLLDLLAGRLTFEGRLTPALSNVLDHYRAVLRAHRDRLDPLTLDGHAAVTALALRHGVRLETVPSPPEENAR